ncbi:uncharacterized protein O3C94_020173 [Discoglossus pictus]
MRSPREIKEEEIPVNISEDVTPPVVSKVEQEDLNIRDQQQVKEEESPGNIREGSERGKSSILSELHQEEETDVKSHPEVKEEEIPVNIGEGKIFPYSRKSKNLKLCAAAKKNNQTNIIFQTRQLGDVFQEIKINIYS